MSAITEIDKWVEWEDFFIVDWSQTGFKDEPSFMLMDVASGAQACLFSSQKCFSFRARKRFLDFSINTCGSAVPGSIICPEKDMFSSVLLSVRMLSQLFYSRRFDSS